MVTHEQLLAERNNLHRFALRLTRNQSDADDLLQSTLLRALEKSDYFQDGTNVFSWASKIMFNLFAGQYRRKKKFETQYDPMPYLEQSAVAPSQETVTDLGTVKEAMKKLSREHREILVLVCVQGLRYEEVSETLNIPVGTVRSRLFRARGQLQAMLETPGERLEAQNEAAALIASKAQQALDAASGYAE